MPTEKKKPASKGGPKKTTASKAAPSKPTASEAAQPEKKLEPATGKQTYRAGKPTNPFVASRPTPRLGRNPK